MHEELSKILFSVFPLTGSDCRLFSAFAKDLQPEQPPTAQESYVDTDTTNNNRNNSYSHNRRNTNSKNDPLTP